MCVRGNGCVGVPMSLAVCVCMCFLEGRTRKRCIDALCFMAGGGGGALVWGVWFLGLRGCGFQGCGSKSLDKPPTATRPPPKEKPPSNLASGLVYVVSTARPVQPPPPPQAPKSPQNPPPPPKPPKGAAPKVCTPTWGVSLCIVPFSLNLIFELVIITSVG